MFFINYSKVMIRVFFVLVLVHGITTSPYKTQMAPMCIKICRKLPKTL